VERPDVPEAWIGREVRIELGERIPERASRGGPAFTAVSGKLADVSRFGATLEIPPSYEVEARTSFYPWNAIREIRLTQ
jgi:hypothetical protein